VHALDEVVVMATTAAAGVVNGPLHELVLDVFGGVVLVQVLEKLHVTILDRYHQERIRPDEQGSSEMVEGDHLRMTMEARQRQS